MRWLTLRKGRVTIGFLLQLLGESRLAHVVHEFEQVLPTFTPETGLHVTQEGDVLLTRVCLREQILKRLTQRQQDMLMIHRFVPETHTHTPNHRHPNISSHESKTKMIKM